MIFIVVVVMLIVRVQIIGVVAHPVVVRPVTTAIIVLVPVPSNCDSNGHWSNTALGLDDATRKAGSKADKQCSRDWSFHTAPQKVSQLTMDALPLST